MRRINSCNLPKNRTLSAAKNCVAGHRSGRMMKLRQKFRHALLVGLMSVSQAIPTSAADFYWDTDTSAAGNSAITGVGLGGTGTWDTSTANWWDSASLVVWPNASADRAIFTGPLVFPPSTSTVTVNSGITTNGLSFLRSGYTLTGGDITLAGTSPGLFVTTGDTATIGTQILGSSGLVKTGGGSIRLTNSLNSYTGTTTIQGGSIIIDSATALGGTGVVSILSGNNTPSNTNVQFTNGSLVLDGTNGGFTFSRGINFEGRGPLGDRSSAIMSLGNNTLSGVLTSAVSPLSPATFRNSRINSVNGMLTISGTLNVGGTVGTTFTTLGGINMAGVNNFSLAGATIVGTGSIEKSGAGFLDLSSASSVTGFTGSVRVAGSSIGQQSSIRVSQATVGGTSVFGAGTGTGTSAAIDLAGGVLEFRSNSSLDFNSLTTGKNVYLRTSSVVYSGPGAGGDALNGTTTLGLFRVAQGQTGTFRSRNGFGTTLQAWTQESANGNVAIANEMGGTLTFTGEVWGNNADASTRNLTFSGNGNTRIVGSITATGTAKQLIKQGSGELIINGVASDAIGATSIEGGTVRITDFRSINNGATPPAISLGNATTTGGTLIIGGTGVGTGTAGGLTTSKAISLNATTATNSIYANQPGANPVILNGNISQTINGSKVLTLGGSSGVDNRVAGVISDGATGITPITANYAAAATTITLASVDGISVGAAISGTGITAGTTVTAINAGTRVVTLSAPTTAAGTAPLNITVAGVVNRTGLTKTGTGTWVLGGANTYTGTTTLSQGTLKLNANGAVSSVLSTANGITFAQTNSFSGATLELVGQASTSNVQNLGALTLSSGMNTIRLTPGATGGTASLSFTSLAAPAAGSGLNIVSPGVGNTVTISGVDGLVDRTIYFGGADFAYRAANVLRAPVYGGVTPDAGFVTSATALTGAANNEITGSFATNNASVNTLKISGAQTLTINAGQALTLTGGGLLSTGGNAAITGGTLALGTQALVARVNTNQLTISSAITGSGGLTKNGTGTLIMASTTAAQTGTITINEGTVQLSGVGSRLGAAADLVIRQGGTLDLNGVTPGTITNAFTNMGTITSTGAATFTVGGNNGTGTSRGIFTGALSVTKNGTGAQGWLGSSTNTGVITIGSTGLVTVDTLANGGVASGIGASTNAASNLVFNGSTGGLVYQGNISDGDLTLGSRSASTDRLFTLAAAATGATLSSTASNNNAIVWSNTGAIVNNTTAGATLIFTGTSAGDNTFNPILSNSTASGTPVLNVNKTAAGQWNLGSTNISYTGNTYTGLTTVSDGILGLNVASALPSNSPLVLGAAATSGILQTTGTFARDLATTAAAGTGSITWGGTTGGGGFAAHAGPLTVTLNSGAGLTWGSGGFVGTGGVQSLILNSGSSISNVTFTNPIDLGTAARTVNVNDNPNTGADYADLTGVLSGAGGGLIKAGAGVLRLTGNNSYTGVTAIQGGSIVASSLGSSTGSATSNVGAGGVVMNDANAIALGAGGAQATNLIYVGGGEVSDRKIRLNATGTNHANAIYADGSGPLVLSNVANDMLAGAKTLSLRGTNTGGNMITGVLANNGADALSVTVDGGASWILSGNNTYSGNTTAGAGALGIGNAAALGTGTLIVNNGNVFAYGSDQTIATNPLTLSNNASNGWLGDYNLTFNAVTNFGATDNNVTTYNNIAAGKALILNGGVTANALTGNRAWTYDGPGETIVNGNFTSSTGFGVRIDVNGGGTFNLGTNGATSDWNKSILAADVDRGTLKFSANNAIPTTFTAATAPTTAGTGIGVTTYTVGSTAGLVVGQTFSGTNVIAGSRIVSIDSPTTFTSSAAPTTAVASGATLTFGGSLGINMTPELVTGDIARLDLNGTIQTLPGLTATSDGTAIITNSAVGAATLIVGANNTAATFGTGGVGTYSITQPAGVINLSKVGTGTANFTGTLGNTGTATSNGGTLNINSSSLVTSAVGDGGAVNFRGGFTTPGNLLTVTTNNGGLVSFANGAGTPFSSLTGLSLSTTANSGLELDVGDSGIDTLTTSAATVGNVTTLFIKDVDISSGGTYNLLVSPGGGLGASSNYLLNLPGYSGSILNVTPNLVSLTAGTLVTSDVFWNNGTGLGGGTLTSAWNSVDGVTTNTNFASDATGLTTLLTNASLPGKGQKVVFQADNIAGGLPLATTLEQGFTINAIEFRPSAIAANTSATVLIAPGAVSSNSLTIKPTLTTDGINLQSGASGTVSISAPIVAGTAQTWTVGDAPVELAGGVTTLTNPTIVDVTSTTGLRPGMTITGTGIPAGTTVVSVNSATQVTISQNATAAGTGLNILAAQQLNLSGTLSGAGNITKAGSGKLVLNGANGTPTGTFTNAAGITQVNTLSSLGGAVGVNGSGSDITVSGGSFYYNNGTSGIFVNDISLSGGTLSAGGNAQTYSGNVNVASNSNINMRDQASSSTFSTTARNITLSGVVSGSGNLTIDGSTTLANGNAVNGNLTLTNAANTWTGDVFFNQGSLFLNNLASPSFTGNNITYNSFGRINIAGLNTTLNRTGTLNFGAGAIGEFGVDNTDAVPTSFVVNQTGAVNLGSGGTGASLRSFFQDDQSTMNINGAVNLGGNSSISVAAAATRLLTINGVINDGVNSYSLAFNDDAGGWAQTNGTVRLTSANSYDGGTTLASGILQLGNKDALGTGALTVSAASTLQATTDLSGANAIVNPTTLNAGLTVSGTNSVQLSGAFTGTGVDAAQTLTNSLTGPAALTISSGVNLVGPLVVNTAARNLTIAGAGATTISGVIADGNALFGNGITKTGTGTLTISGVNTFTGTVTHSAVGPAADSGLIVVTSTNGLGTGPANLTFGTTGGTPSKVQLQLSGGVTLGNSSFTTTGAGSDGTTSGIIRSVSGANVISGVINMTGGGGASTYRADSGSTLTFNGNVGGITAQVSRIVNLVGGGNFVFAGTIQNSNDATASTVGINSTNTGTTTLSGINTYTLGTTSGAGNTLIAGSTQAFGVGSATTVDGTLRLAGFSNSIGSLAGTLSTSIVENANASPATLTTGGNNSSTTFSGLIQDGTGGGALSLTKTGTGAMTLSGTNTYSGGTTLSGGTLTASSDSALGTGALSFSGTGQRLVVNDGVTISNNITIGTNAGVAFRGLIENSGAGNATVTGGTITINNIPAAGGTFASASGGTLTIASAINSSVPVSIRTGTVILSGGGTYSDLSVTGTGRLGANNGISTSATVDVAVSGAGNLDLAGFNQQLVGITRSTANAGIIGNSSTTSDSVLTTTGTSVYSGIIQNVLGSGTRNVALTVNGGALTLTGTNTYTGVTTISGGTLQVGNGTDAGSIEASNGIVNNAALVYNVASGTRSYGNVISGTGSITQNSTGGTLTLSGTNTYTGATSVGTGGSLVAGSTQAFGVNSATTVLGTLALAGNSNALGSLAGSGAVENASATAATLTIGGDNSSTVFSGLIQNGAGGGALSLVKTGTGTQTISGVNTFSGTTVVNGGTLLVNSVGGLGASNVTINGGFLGGTGGVVTGGVTLAGGSITPGSSIGTLGVGSVSGTGSLGIEYDSSNGTIDLLTIAGALDISSLALNFSDFSGAPVPLTQPFYVFATYGSLVGSNFTSISGLPANYAVDYNYLSGNQIALVTAVPEPGTLALLTVVIVGGGLYRRSRNQKKAKANA